MRITIPILASMATLAIAYPALEERTSVSPRDTQSKGKGKGKKGKHNKAKIPEEDIVHLIPELRGFTFNYQPYGCLPWIGLDGHGGPIPQEFLDAVNRLDVDGKPYWCAPFTSMPPRGQREWHLQKTKGAMFWMPGWKRQSFNKEVSDSIYNDPSQAFAITASFGLSLIAPAMEHKSSQVTTGDFFGGEGFPPGIGLTGTPMPFKIGDTTIPSYNSSQANDPFGGISGIDPSTAALAAQIMGETPDAGNVTGLAGLSGNLTATDLGALGNGSFSGLGNSSLAEISMPPSPSSTSINYSIDTTVGAKTTVTREMMRIVSTSTATAPGLTRIVHSLDLTATDVPSTLVTQTSDSAATSRNSTGAASIVSSTVDTEEDSAATQGSASKVAVVTETATISGI